MGKGRGSKRQRSRRAWFKPFSRSSLNSGPSRIASTFINREPVLITIGARNKAARSIRDPGLAAYLDKLYPVKFDLERATPDQVLLHAKNGNPRAILKLRTLSDRRQTEYQVHEVYLHNTNYLKVKCYFTQEEATLVRMVIRGATMRVTKSIIYSDIKRAKTAYVSGRVCWVEPVRTYELDDSGEPIIPPQVEPNPLSTS